MIYLQFFSVAFLPPMFGWMLNLAVRRKEALHSSGADWLLVLIVLDFTALVDAESFSKFIHYSEWKEHAAPCFAVVFIVAFIAWLCHIFFVEPKLRVVASSLWQNVWKNAVFCLGWVFAILVCTTNVMIFIYSPT